MFQEIDVFFFCKNIEMKEIVFLIKTVNSLYLKVEVHPHLLIFESNFFGPR